MTIDNDDGNSEDDEALWRYVTRNVTPLGPSGRNIKYKIAKKSAVCVENTTKPDKNNDTCSGNRRSKKSGREVDRQTARRFGRGKMEIAGRIDLHGLSRSKARDRLEGFLSDCYDDGRRQILVITGKGRRSRKEDDRWWEPAPALLRDLVPQWLDEPPLSDIVLQYNKAQPRDGGEGALYVFLRRKR